MTFNITYMVLFTLYFAWEHMLQCMHATDHVILPATHGPHLFSPLHTFPTLPLNITLEVNHFPTTKVTIQWQVSVISLCTALSRLYSLWTPVS